MVEQAQKAAEEPKSATDAKEEESKESLLPPPIVFRVFMHCEGCASKLRRFLKGFDGVDDVKTDCKTHTIVVEGEKADPLKVLERIQKKSNREVELLSPVPKSPAGKPENVEKKEAPKPEENKEEPPPQVITVVLKVHMHCEACGQEIRKRILKMNGVESVEADLKKSEVAVKGTFEPPQLVEYVNKRMGKRGVIVKQDPEPKKPEGNKGGDGKVEKKEEEKTTAKPVDAVAGEEKKVVELRKNEFDFNQTIPPRYALESVYGYPTTPQIFSDENPNACYIM